MGAASRKRKRKQVTAESAGSPPVEVEALDHLAPRPFIPPRGAVIALLGLVIAGMGYFVFEGLRDVRLGEGRLAEKLLRVESRDEAPKPFELTTMDGSKLGLSELRDKVVFVNFWATWCPPCVEEMPSMRRLRAKLADDDRFVMLAVSTDEGWDEVKQFFRGEKPPFPVLLDPGGDLAKRYGTEKFPETYVVVGGRLVAYIIGPRDWDTWYAESYLRSLLQHSRPS